MHRLRIVAAAAALSLLSAAPAAAASNDDVDHCQRQHTNGDIDLAIAGCTGMIRSGDWSGRNLAPIYFQRGNAYFDKAEYDKAVHDFDKALQLKPNDPAALMDRGLAKIKLGDIDGGNADLAASKAAKAAPTN